MRFRIQTYSPLPDIKAWFVPEAQDVLESIHDLKETLCRRVQALKNYHGKDLILLLEGFELLDDSPFDAVEDAKMDVAEAPRERKRKRSQSKPISPPSRVLQAPPSKKSVIKLSKVSSSEESSSESDSSSTTSESSSSSSSSSVSPPKPLPSRQPAATPSTTHVPPGLGKPTTHSRNKRRRKKKDYEKQGKIPSTPAPPKSSSEANTLPFIPQKPISSTIPTPTSRVRDGTAPDVAISLNTAFLSNASGLPGRHALEDDDANPQPVYITQDQVMMGSLRNKNKKKGFKQSMGAPIPQKIIFSEAGPANNVHPPEAESSNRDTEMIDVNAPQPRLIPPSEIQDLGQLPPNMFVTSVDVEAGIWDDNSGKKSSKRKGKKRQPVEEWHEYEESTSVELPYAEVDVDGAQASSSSKFDWDRAEKLWEKYAVVKSIEQLGAGGIIGWKALDINPKTFSPEVMLSVARVISIPQDISSPVVVRQLLRPGASQAALAFGLSGRDAEEDEGEGEEKSVEWPEVLQSEWRLVNL